MQKLAWLSKDEQTSSVESIPAHHHQILQVLKNYLKSGLLQEIFLFLYVRKLIKNGKILYGEKMSGHHILVKGLVCIFWSTEWYPFGCHCCEVSQVQGPHVFAYNSSICFTPLPFSLSLFPTGPFSAPRVVPAHPRAAPQPGPSSVWSSLLLVSALGPGGGAMGLRL